jgi:hypothetical protein
VLTLSRFHALMELDSEITEAMHNIGDCIVAKVRIPSMATGEYARLC